MQILDMKTYYMRTKFEKTIETKNSNQPFLKNIFHEMI
jgi:hypothetical protein